jgi:hypothetical protein
MANHGKRLEERSRGPDLNQNDRSGEDRDRSRRLHGDAKLAVVGVLVERMHVRHLDDRQEGQQGQAQNGSERQSAPLRSAVLAEMP